MTYQLSGEFIEACDCRVICPCWIDQGPDNGSCTGLFAWSITTGTVEGVDVSGHHAVSVSTHLGPRSPGAGTPGSDQGVTVLVLDADPGTPAHTALTNLFTGALGGPVADIVAVIDSPPLAVRTASVTLVAGTSVTVDLPTPEALTVALEPVLGADGQQTTVAHQHLDPGLAQLDVARNTAIDIAVVDPGPVDPALAGTYLFDFTQPGYSASSGAFAYTAP